MHFKFKLKVSDKNLPKIVREKPRHFGPPFRYDFTPFRSLTRNCRVRNLLRSFLVRSSFVTKLDFHVFFCNLELEQTNK